MKLLLTCILTFSIALSSAQSIDKIVTASAGSEMKASSFNIGFTIGETIVGIAIAEHSIDQGFWAGSLQVEAITAEKELGGIRVYPNPVESELTIFTNDNEIFGITLYSVNGQRVFMQNVKNIQPEHIIDLSQLSKGMYVLRLFVKNDSEEKLFKIIKK